MEDSAFRKPKPECSLPFEAEEAPDGCLAKSKDLYNQVESLTYGSNSVQQIDIQQAIRLAKTLPNDPVLLAYLGENYHEYMGDAKTADEHYNRSMKCGLLEQAEGGCAYAQNAVGHMHYLGKGGLEMNRQKAYEWIANSAAQGVCTIAYCNLGCFHGDGYGGPGAQTPRELYELAIAEGSSYAEYRLAVLYDEAKDYDKAKQWYERASDRGYAGATNNLGYLYQKGYVGNKGEDYEKARELYQQAADLNDPDGLYNVGYLLVNGHIGEKSPQDYEKAAEHLAKSAARGRACALNVLGDLYENGYVGNNGKDYTKAADFYQQALNLGDLFAHSNLAYLHEEGSIGDGKDYNAAHALYHAAAVKGCGYAQRNLGIMYYEGRVGDNGADYKRARQLFELSVAQDYDVVESQNFLGFMFDEGLGGDRDHDKAAGYYERAAEQGLVEAQANLGLLYEEELCHAYETAKIRKDYEIVAEENRGLGDCLLGFLAEYGLSTSDLHEKAVVWYTKAAENGYALAQYRLGGFFEKGLGNTVAKDDAKALEWYRKAADQGIEKAAAALRNLQPPRVETDTKEAHPLDEIFC